MILTAFYPTGKRKAYTMSNKNGIVVHKLTSAGNKTASVYDADGNAYVKDSFDPHIKLSGKTVKYASDSAAKARVNTIRLGEYYYECHVRDLDFSLITSDPEFELSAYFPTLKKEVASY